MNLVVINYLDYIVIKIIIVTLISEIFKFGSL